MDALLSTLLSVFFAEVGDRTQILAAALAIRYRGNGKVLAGLTLATLCNCLISAFAGSVIDGWISEEPLRLFTALSYIFAGAGMLMWRRRVNVHRDWGFGALLTSFAAIFTMQIGDKSQFLIAANAANTPHWGFALTGGFIGIMAAVVPAILMKERLAAMLPLRKIRQIAGSVMLLWGGFMVLGAFKLI
jgi:Ca2+/H+ antiporter, TMEM165/GDT1 family